MHSLAGWPRFMTRICSIQVELIEDTYAGHWDRHRRPLRGPSPTRSPTVGLFQCVGLQMRGKNGRPSSLSFINRSRVSAEGKIHSGLLISIPVFWPQLLGVGLRVDALGRLWVTEQPRH